MHGVMRSKFMLILFRKSMEIDIHYELGSVKHQGW